MTARRGAALLTAMAMLVLIATVALDQAIAAKARRRIVAAGVDRTALDAAATGGIEHARALLQEMLQVGAMQSLRDATRVIDAWTAADGLVLVSEPSSALRYRVSVSDIGARLNLNAATPDQLRILLLALDVDARRADHLAQSISDWRDADRLRRVNGAEREDYLRDGRAILPDDGPFVSVGGLRFVFGMNDSLYRIAAPHLTVLGSGRVNINAAQRPVLLTLPGMTNEAVAHLLSERRQGRQVRDLYRFAEALSPTARALLRTAMPVLQASTVLEAREMSIASESWRVGGAAHLHIDAVVSRDDEGRVVWRRVSP